MTLTFALTPRRPAYLPHRSRARVAPIPPGGVHEQAPCEAAPPFRLVLPRAKRDRLVELTAALAQRRCCSVRQCSAECLPVVLVESEREALLCPRHQLVALDGSAIEGQPLLATAAW